MRNTHSQLSRLLIPMLLLAAVLASRAAAQQGPVPVATAPVEKRGVAITQPLVASVEAVTRSTLAAELAGLVAERAFEEGQEIKKGQSLAKLKTDLLEAQLAAAEAARRTAEAGTARATAQAEQARAEVDRMRKLAETRTAAGKELRDVLTEEKVRSAEVTAGQAEMAEKAAEIDRLKLMIAKSHIESPIDGVVSKRHVEVGQWLQQGDPVADVVQLDPLFVRVNVPEGVISRVNAGDTAVVTIDALGGKRFEGKVDQMLPEADPASRTFAVKIRLPNPGHQVRPGFFARATLTSQADAVLLVPKDALIARGKQSHVVAARGGKAVIVPVKRGTTSGDLIAVTGELTEEDRVVIRGNEQLRGGEDLLLPPPVPPAPPAAAAAGQ